MVSYKPEADQTKIPVVASRMVGGKLLLDGQLLTWLQTLAKSDHTDKEERNDENWRFIQGAARASTHEHGGLCGARRGGWHRHAGEPTRRGPPPCRGAPDAPFPWATSTQPHLPP